VTLCIELPGLFSRYLFTFKEWCVVAGVTLCHLCVVGVPVYFSVRDAIYSRLFNSGWVRDFRFSKQRCWRFNAFDIIYSSTRRDFLEDLNLQQWLSSPCAV